MRVAVAGAGYVGLLTGLVFADHGHDVVFSDPDRSKLDAIQRGQPPFHEPGLPELLTRARPKITVEPSLEKAVAASDVTFLCVGTPSRPDGSIDLAYVRSAAAQVGAGLRSVRGSSPPEARSGSPRGPHLVVTKSTVVPGTCDDVVSAEVAKSSGLVAGRDFHAMSNPEFLREGAAVHDACNPDRVVVGSHDAAAAQRLLQLYTWTEAPKRVVPPATAEMIKYASNTFLAVKVGLSNEFANLCARVGVDWLNVAAAVGMDPRIGGQFLRAGVGFGGSCFPKDLAAIVHRAAEVGAPLGIAQASLANNAHQYEGVVRMLTEELGTLRGKTIALLGLAFKADTDDVRESRAVPIHNALVAAGASVRCHDPIAAAGANFGRLVPGAAIAAGLDDALRGADAVVLQTEAREYKALDGQRLRSLLRTPVVVDGRRTLDAAAMRAAGLRYRAIGLGEARKAN